MGRLARLMRWALGAPGTRWALAILRGVSAPTARSVSATAEAGVRSGCAQRKYSSRVSSAAAPSGAGGSCAVRSSRLRRASLARTRSRNLRHAVVTSQPFGSRGGWSGQVRSASMRPSWTASSAAAKSAPRRTRTLITSGTSERSRSSSITASGGAVRGLVQERAQLQPLAHGPTAGARSRGELAGKLQRPVVAVHVDHHPARDQVLRLRERAVGHRRLALAVEPDERAFGGERLGVHVLSGALQLVGEVVHVLHVRVPLRGRPLLHRYVVGRSRGTAIVLEQQVLGHQSSPWVGAAGPAAFIQGTEPGTSSRHRRGRIGVTSQQAYPP